MAPFKLLLLGRTQRDYGSFACEQLDGGSTACTLSVGADPDSPSLAAKGDAAHPNEDALLAFDDGTTCVAAVADAHFGNEASHVLLERLFDNVGSDIRTLDQLRDVVCALAGDSSVPSRSATTLLVVVYRRDLQRGFGVSYGDSTCALVDAVGCEMLNEQSVRYVAPTRAGNLAPENAREFTFTAPRDALLLAFTDGIDECHYGRPETSVRPHHMRDVYESSGGDPERFARALTALALAGVDGNPGGQDNIALIATRA